MSFLIQVDYILPNSNKTFNAKFLKYLSSIGNTTDNKITLNRSNNNYYPVTNIIFTDITTPKVSFVLNDNNSIDINIINTTNVSKTSHHQYSHILLENFIKRIAPFNHKYIDHTGFNLPFFDGIHPEIVQLRESLKKTSLYHTFPKHLEDANWDFILPASEKEINNTVKTDYTQIRRPKIEIVSFDKCSTPLIQFDIQLEGAYKDWVKIFPEAIQVPEIKSLWVYIQNDYDIDICFVLNEEKENDWSYQFKNTRLM
ncbi:hypothetical protein ACFL1P_00985 [Patescibacteria group bacterium]